MAEREKRIEQLIPDTSFLCQLIQKEFNSLIFAAKKIQTHGSPDLNDNDNDINNCEEETDYDQHVIVL